MSSCPPVRAVPPLVGFRDLGFRDLGFGDLGI